MASSDSQIDKPQHGRPKRAELPDVNINTGAQSINTERVFIYPQIDGVGKYDCMVICFNTDQHKFLGIKENVQLWCNMFRDMNENSFLVAVVKDFLEPRQTDASAC